MCGVTVPGDTYARVSGIDVVRAGRDWAESGVPELSQLYAEVAEV